VLSKQVNSTKIKGDASKKKSNTSSVGTFKDHGKTGSPGKKSGKPVDALKFALYFDFKAYISVIKPHQVSLNMLQLFYNLQAGFLTIICLVIVCVCYFH